MSGYLLVFLIAVTTALALTPMVGWVACRLEVLDAPDGFRKLQRRPIPRMGGVSVFVAFFASFLLAVHLWNAEQRGGYPTSGDFVAVLVGAAWVLAVGLFDDLYGLGARRKFALLALVAGAMYVEGHQIRALSNPFGAPVYLGFWAFPVTFLWFVGCMHSMNLIDGLDGLAAGVTLFATITVFVASVLFHNSGAGYVCTALAGAVLGFLFFNFHPASIYLGDSGSYLLGFLIACIGLRGAQKGNTVIGLLIPLIALGLPVMDTALTVIRRWSQALPLSAADRQHIHHKLVRLGFTHRQTVLLMYGSCVVLAGFALLMVAATNLTAAALLTVLGLVTFLAVRVLGRNEMKLARRRLTGYFKHRRRSKQCRYAGYTALERMEQAKSVVSVWQIFSDAAEQIEIDNAWMKLNLPVNSDVSETRVFRWRRKVQDSNDNSAVLWCATLPLMEGGASLGKLRICKSTNGLPLRPELPEILEDLSAGLATNIKRVQLTYCAPTESSRQTAAAGSPQ